MTTASRHPGSSVQSLFQKRRHTKILGAQPSITLSISVRSVGVLASVNLNDQTRVEARKVDNVLANRNLLAKAMTIDVLAPKELPE